MHSSIIPLLNSYKIGSFKKKVIVILAMSKIHYTLAERKDLDPTAYVWIPETANFIAQYQSCNGQEHFQTIESLGKGHLFMPSLASFFLHFNNVILAQNRVATLYDGTGGVISPQKTEELYECLTANCWARLNAQFIKGEQGLNIVETYLDIQEEVAQLKNVKRTRSIMEKRELSSPLEQCLQENCFVDLIFNAQGLPVNKSEVQGYSKGKNMNFFPLQKGSVARFVSRAGRAGLYCDRDPRDSNGGLGTFACAAGVAKI